MTKPCTVPGCRLEQRRGYDVCYVHHHDPAAPPVTGERPHIGSHQRGCAAYKRDNCRCHTCRVACRRYDKSRQLRRAEGRRPYVDAAKARDHLNWLNSTAVRGQVASLRGRRGTAEMWWFTAAARLQGLARPQLQRIASGDIARIRPATGRKIMTLDIDRADGGDLVDAGPTRAYVRVLLDAGWTAAGIARAIPGRPDKGRPAALQIGRGRLVRRVTADAIRDLALRHAQPPPGVLPSPRPRDPETGRFLAESEAS